MTPQETFYKAIEEMENLTDLQKIQIKYYGNDYAFKVGQEKFDLVFNQWNATK